MIKNLLSFFLFAILSFTWNINAEAQQLAFPGAEGAGRFANGGRGTNASPTTVFVVSSLGDANVPGTLRHAVSQSTATFPHRTIVFRVSGTIRLLAPLTIRGNITIAGQTAPGDGICIADQPVTISGSNVILRYLRIRMGDRYQNLGMVDGSGNGDALGSLGHKNIIIDHCSIGWSSDEALTIYRGDSTTIQWSIIAEPLNYSYHFEAGGTDYQEHGYGGIWGARRGSFHHNIIAHAKGRLPRFAGSSTYPPGTAGQENANFYNNVIYNWQSYSTNGGEGGNYNILNNYYKYGPNTSTGSTAGVPVRSMIMNPSVGNGLPFPKIYADGNYVDGYPNATNRNWLGFAMSGGSLNDTNQSKVLVPFDISPYNLQSATDAYQSVLTGAGAILPRRDTLDRRIVDDVRFRTGKIIDVQGGFPHGTPFDQTVGAWPNLKSKPALADSDNDGMPDAWENANGLNPSYAADRQTIAPNGYTNLENYLNSIVNINPEIYCSGALTTFLAMEGMPTSSQSYTVEGINLGGALTVKPPTGFEVSADNGVTWFTSGSPLLLNPVSGVLAPTTIQLRMNIGTGNYAGNILHFTADSDTTFLFTSGTITSATEYPVSIIRWPMTSGNADDAASRHPGLEASVPTFTNLYLSNGTTVGAVPPYGNTHGQAFSPAADGSGLWTTASGGPGGTLRRTFYQEFKIVPKNGQSGVVDSIILNASYYNTESNTRFAIVFSKSGFITNDSTDISGGIGPNGQPLAAGANGKFVTPMLLPNQTGSTTSNYRIALNGSEGVALNEGESLTFRMYFSCGSGSPGRYAKIKEVNVKGRMNNTLSLGGLFFNGLEQNGNILLNWKSASLNESGIYKVQRRTMQSEFTTIASVPSSNIAEGKYRYTDESAPKGIPLFYRLKHTDLSGKETFSSIVLINRSGQSALMLHPNPATTSFTLLHPEYERPVVMQIVGSDGRTAKQQIIAPFVSKTEVRVQALQGGVYYIILSNGKQVQSVPFLKY
jgi:hypothetical protein